MGIEFAVLAVKKWYYEKFENLGKNTEDICQFWQNFRTVGKKKHVRPET